MLFSHDLGGAVARVVDHEHPVIYGIDDVIGQKGGSRVIIEIASDRIGHSGRDQRSGLFVDGLKGRLIGIVTAGALVISDQQQIVSPGAGVDRTFIGDDFIDHRCCLGGIGSGQPADVHIGHRIITAEGDKPLIGDGLALKVGKHQIGGQIGGVIGLTPVVFGVIGAVAHQQHILRGGRWPVAVSIG